MTEESPSCVASKVQVGDLNATTTAGAALPTAYLVEDGVGEVVLAVSVAHDVTHEGGAGNPDSQQGLYQSGCFWWFVMGLGWLYVFTALTQAIVAGAVSAQGIVVVDYFIGEAFYPPAGNPWIGMLHFFIAVLFLAGYRFKICGSVFFVFFTVSVCIVSFGWSFGERGVYNALKDFDQCIDNNSGNYTLDWGGDCYCSDDVVHGAPAVNVDVSTSCDNILDYVDAILVSYIFMVVLMGFSVVAIFVCCKASQYELSMPYRR